MSSTSRAGPLGQGGDDVACGGLGHVGRGSPARGEHGAALLGGQHGQQGLARQPPARVAQVVPPPAGQVLDAGGHLEATTQQVEVDDDRRWTGRREPTADGEGERARAEATGGTDDGCHAGLGRHPGSLAGHPGRGHGHDEPVDDAAAPGRLWTRRPDLGRPRSAAGPVRGAGMNGRVRTWDGPGRGDNRGRRRAELRGGEAGPPFAQPRGGASEPIVSHHRLSAQALVTTCRHRSQVGSSTTESEGLANPV